MERFKFISHALFLYLALGILILLYNRGRKKINFDGADVNYVSIPYFFSIFRGCCFKCTSAIERFRNFMDRFKFISHALFLYLASEILILLYNRGRKKINFDGADVNYVSIPYFVPFLAVVASNVPLALNGSEISWIASSSFPMPCFSIWLREF
jgi:hypothetical protein